MIRKRPHSTQKVRGIAGANTQSLRALLAKRNRTTYINKVSCTTQPLSSQNIAVQHQKTTLIYNTIKFTPIIHMQPSFPTDMEAGSQLALRDQLFESAAIVLDTINRAGLSGIPDVDTLDQGLRSLQDTLLGSDYISTPRLGPFYLLCIQLCDDLNKQLSLNGSALDSASVSVTDRGLGELREVLLASFHALNTYLNIIRWYVKPVSFGSSMLRYRSARPGYLMTIPSADVWPASRVPFVTLRDIENTSMT